MTVLKSTRSLPQLALLLFAALGMGGCVTSTTSQSFKVSKDSRVESSRIAVDADFGKYDRLTADDMGIYFPTDSTPSEEDQQHLRQIFRNAFLTELSGYQIVETKGPTTMLVSASLIDYRNASGADVPLVRREIREMTRPGAIVFLMEFKDSQSGKILARAADSADAPAISASPNIPTDWTAVETAAARWAGLFREFLDQNLNTR